MTKKEIANVLRNEAVLIKKAHRELEATQNVIAQVLVHQIDLLRDLTTLAAKLENEED